MSEHVLDAAADARFGQPELYDDSAAAEADAAEGATNVELMDADEARREDMREAALDALDRAVVAWPRWRVQLVSTDDGEVIEFPRRDTYSPDPSGAYEVRAVLDVVMAALYRYAAALEGIVALDMDESGATEKLIRGVLYSYAAGSPKLVTSESEQVEALKKLIAEKLLDQADYDAAVTEKVVTTTTVDQRVINGLIKKRGAKVAAVLGATQQRIPQPRRLSIKRT